MRTCLYNMILFISLELTPRHPQFMTELFYLYKFDIWIWLPKPEMCFISSRFLWCAINVLQNPIICQRIWANTVFTELIFLHELETFSLKKLIYLFLFLTDYKRRLNKFFLQRTLVFLSVLTFQTLS